MTVIKFFANHSGWSIFPISYFLLPTSYVPPISPQIWGDAKLARAKQGGAISGGSAHTLLANS